MDTTDSNHMGELNQFQHSLISFSSTDEFGHSCRICRYNRSNLLIQECPCECKGSVGFIHIKCLRRWILRRGNDKCEICGVTFTMPPRKWSFQKLFWSFFKAKYIGAILKNIIHLITLAPISYLVLNQVFKIMDNLEFLEFKDNTLQLRAVVLAPIILFTSSIIFFYILEFSIARCLVIKNVVKHWWMFGGQVSD